MIRWMQPGDVPGIVDLVRTELVPLSTRSHPRDSRLYTDVRTRLRRGETLVASDGRKSGPFAFIHMEFRGSTMYIDMLAVHSGSQHRSWGTELMNRAEKYGLSKGCIESRLFVDDTNYRGMRFYEKLGYSVVRDIKELKCYEMYKSLLSSYGDSNPWNLMNAQW
ncbi:GNAT family N-acetyltransferase [Cohnella pontilimi]|uniref:GNAT family N-acetyltransferase n=1 Tax=Cohnella pontilimi TaxID=2564100 RepID=A0A4V5LS34_9BACL|nr:GNAT family N-acetyltransferase [Cohnella pontilimi]TJY40969.1 GNAT family N-acetyltransferase [Cohnella pontilimi]